MTMRHPGDDSDKGLKARSTKCLSALWRTVLSYAFSMLGFWLVVTWTALKLVEQNIDPNTIGLFAAMPWLAVICLTSITPAIIRRYGFARTYRLGNYLAIVAVVGLMLTDVLIIWFGCNFLFGCCLGMRWVAVDSWILAEAPAPLRGRIIGCHEMISSTMTGGGPLLLYWIGIDQRWLPPVLAIVTFVIALSLSVSHSRSQVTMPQFQQRVIQMIQQYPSVFLVALLAGIVECGVISILPLYASSLGLPLNQTALLVSAVGIGNVVIQYPLGYLSDRISYYSLLLFCSVAALIGFIILPLTQHLSIIFWIVACLWGSILGSFYTLASIRAGSICRKESLVQVLSVVAMVYTLGSLIGPLLGGSALSIWQPHGFTVIFSAITVASLLAIFKLRQQENRAPSSGHKSAR